MSRPFSITESDTVASITDGGNSLTSDAMATGKGTCRPQRITRCRPQRRKLLRPKKRKNVILTTTVVKAEVCDDVGMDSYINHNITNTSLPVGTTDAIQDTVVQNKSILEPHGQQESVRENSDVTEKEQLFEASTISRSIKPEPEAFTLNAAVPVTKNRWV